MDGISGRGGTQGMDPTDLFAQFFGAGMFGFDPAGPGPGGRRGKGPEVIQHEVTLEDLYNGKSVKMNMEREAVCGQCHGYSLPARCSSSHDLIFISLGLGHGVMLNPNHA